MTPASGYHNEAEIENENLGDAIYHLPNQKKRERDWIIKEIVDTEWKYITNLKGKFHYARFSFDVHVPGNGSSASKSVHVQMKLNESNN